MTYMNKKKYSSYKQIDAELEILKLEKEIHHQKLVLSFEKTKEILMPNNFMSNIIRNYKNYFNGAFGSILKTIIPLGITWFLNKKKR